MVDFYHGAPDSGLVDLVHKHGALAGWQVGSLDDARAAEAAGCDLLVVRGVEGGGRMHGSESLWPLLSEVVESVTVPVLAAGGGAGLSREALASAGALLEHTLKAIAACTCEIGCPSCVHSPKCGSGNRPIDKTAAVFILRQMQDPSRASDSKRRLKRPPASKSAINAVHQALTSTEVNRDSTTESAAQDRKEFHFGVFDLETQRSAEEVGGWHHADRMGISCAVLYISDEDRYIEFLEAQTDALIERLRKLDLVIGFNIKRFDYRVLRGYSDYKFETLPTLDILEEIHHHLGYRLSLDHLAQVTLGSKKTANGLQALEWWREGRIRDLIEYCQHDVAITRDLFLYGRENQYLLFKNKAGSTVRVPVKW